MRRFKFSEIMTRNIFDEKISVFVPKPYTDERGNTHPNFDAGEHHVCTIGQFLDDGKNFAPFRDEAREQIRLGFGYECNGQSDALAKAGQNYAALKWTAPCAIMQGVCPTHNDEGFGSYTDVLCLDIDGRKPGKAYDASNPNHKPHNWEAIRDQIATIPCVAYCGLSVSGLGVFVLIPIDSHEHHAERWQEMADFFAQPEIGLRLDEGTKNLSRLRFTSYDEHAYRNEAAEVFCGFRRPLHKEPQRLKAYKPADVTLQPFKATDDTDERVERCVAEIERRGVDITFSEQSWKSACFALANHYGERGRSLFHRVAAFYPRYTFKENEKLYDYAISKGRGKVAINTFFYLCKEAGINISHTPQP